MLTQVCNVKPRNDIHLRGMTLHEHYVFVARFLSERLRNYAIKTRTLQT